MTTGREQLQLKPRTMNRRLHGKGEAHVPSHRKVCRRKIYSGLNCPPCSVLWLLIRRSSFFFIHATAYRGSGWGSPTCAVDYCAICAVGSIENHIKSDDKKPVMKMMRVQCGERPGIVQLEWNCRDAASPMLMANSSSSLAQRVEEL